VDAFLSIHHRIHHNVSHVNNVFLGNFGPRAETIIQTTVQGMAQMLDYTAEETDPLPTYVTFTLSIMTEPFMHRVATFL